MDLDVGRDAVLGAEVEHLLGFSAMRPISEPARPAPRMIR